MATPELQPAVREVMRYFVEHPHTVDSLEGIARWRLLEQRIHDTINETEVALSWLVERGLLRKLDVPGNPPLFGLNLERLGDAEELAS